MDTTPRLSPWTISSAEFNGQQERKTSIAGARPVMRANSGRRSPSRVPHSRCKCLSRWPCAGWIGWVLSHHHAQLQAHDTSSSSSITSRDLCGERPTRITLLQKRSTFGTRESPLYLAGLEGCIRTTDHILSTLMSISYSPSMVSVISPAPSLIPHRLVC